MRKYLTKLTHSPMVVTSALLLICVLVYLLSVPTYWRISESDGDWGDTGDLRGQLDSEGKDGDWSVIEGDIQQQIQNMDDDLVEGDGSDFQDQRFSRILKTFRDVADDSHNTGVKPRFRSGRVPQAYIHVDSAFVQNQWLSTYFWDAHHNTCPFPCAITTDHNKLSKSDVVLVHLRSVKSIKNLLRDLGPRDLTQPWIMFEPETNLQSNAVYHVPYQAFNGIFNRTFHHRRDSDALMVHGFIVSHKEANLLPATWRQEPLLIPDANRTNLAVAFISNCRDNSGRLKYIKDLQEFVSVDVYGKCGSLKCGGSYYVQHRYSADTDPCMKKVAGEYLFFLAFENALCRDYVTEKLYNLLFYPMVPVVMGALDYAEILPPNSYINARDFTPQELGKRLLHLSAHPQEYQRLLVWRKYWQPSTVGGSGVLCDLCTRLHDPAFYQHHVYQDFHHWYVTEAHCNDTGMVHHLP